MADQDSFINEVTEEVRRDKLFALMRRYGWIAILVVVVLVGGAAINEWRKATAQAEAEAAGDALIAALGAETAEARAEALSAIAAEEGAGDAAGRQAIVALMEAGALVETGDRDGARAALESIAANTALPQVYRDLGELKALVLGVGAIAPEDRIARLSPLARPGGAFRLLALEQMALAEIESGNRDAALDTLRGILADAEVTQDLRRRASQLIVALGGKLAAG